MVRKNVFILLYCLVLIGRISNYMSICLNMYLLTESIYWYY